jgi:hypothetical protein
MEREAGYARRFSFGPLERRGIAGSLRAGQLVLLTAGGLGAFIAFRVTSSGAGLFGGLILVLLASLAAFLPFQGMTLEQWAPLAVAYGWRRLTGQDRYRSEHPVLGVIAGLNGRDARREPALPAALDGCEILAVPVAGGQEVGVFHDAAAGSLTAVMAVRVKAFGLLSESEQERRLDRWGQALSSLARTGGLVRRVQILERTVPADGDAMHRYLAEARDPSLGPDTMPRRSYEALLEDAGFVTQDHELFVALQVDERRAASKGGQRSRRRDGDVRAMACAALIREMQSFATRFDPIDVVVEGVLPPRMLARAIRLAYDPYGRERTNRLAAADPAMAGTDPSTFGPLATEESWDLFRSDSAVHRTYWVAQWPRLAVAPTFLAPLLLSADVVRSLSVVLEPVSPERARRSVEAAITSDLADEELRTERGFRTTARQRKRQDAVVRREEELSSGHQEFRFAAFVTVSGPDEEGLELACDQVEQSAHQAYLDLQPLWGEQDAGFTFGALPIGRGLRSTGPLNGGGW